MTVFFVLMLKNLFQSFILMFPANILINGFFLLMSRFKTLVRNKFIQIVIMLYDLILFWYFLSFQFLIYGVIFFLILSKLLTCYLRGNTQRSSHFDQMEILRNNLSFGNGGSENDKFVSCQNGTTDPFKNLLYIYVQNALAYISFLRSKIL